MNRAFGIHAVDESDIVNTLADVREQIADHFPALAIGLEGEFGADDAAFVFVPTAAKGFHLDGLAVEFGEFRFVVEGIDLAGAAVHKQEDHGLGLGREHGLFGCHRVDEAGRRFGGGVGQERVIVQKGGQPQSSEASPGFPEEFAAGAAAELAIGTGHQCLTSQG
jgi:hypothetical protein